MTLSDVFDTELGAHAHRAAMSERRFCFLLRYLRFDNEEARAVREAVDKFASGPEIWGPFTKIIEMYTPAST